MHRPTILPVPALALKIALGEFAGEVLISQRVLPRRLLDAGFAFEHADVSDRLARRALAAFTARREAKPPPSRTSQTSHSLRFEQG